jgi:hypothetical protein
MSSDTTRTTPTHPQIAAARAAYATARGAGRPEAAARVDASYAAMCSGATTAQAAAAATLAATAYDQQPPSERQILTPDNKPGHVWIVIKRYWRGELVTLTATELEERAAQTRLELARDTTYSRTGESQPGDVWIELERITNGTTDLIADPAIYPYHEAQLALFAYFDMPPRYFAAAITDAASEAAFIRLKAAINAPLMERLDPDATYEITHQPDGSAPAITCRRCGSTSHNPHDIVERWCDRCRAFHVERQP